MNVQFDSKVGSSQWQNILGGLGGVGNTQKTEGTQGTQGAGDESLTISDAPATAPGAGDVSAPDDLETPKTTSETAGGEVATTASKAKGVMFDLYALMALLVDVAQQERDSARALRDTENKAIQNSIIAQAEAQRDAAVVGAVVGSICGVLSAGVSVGMLVGQSAAYKQQLNAAGASGNDAAQTHLTVLKGADTEQNAHIQLAEISEKVGIDISTSVADAIDAKVAEPKAQFENARAEAQTAQNRLNDRTETLRDTGVNPDNFDIADLRQQKATAQTEFDQAQQAKDNFQGDQNSPEYQQLTQTVEAKRTNLVDADTKVRAAEQFIEAKNDNTAKQATLAEKRENYRIAIDNAASDFAESYTNTTGRKLNSANAYKEASATAKADYQAAKDAVKANDTPENRQALADATDRLIAADVSAGKKGMAVAYAYAADKLASEGLMTPAEYKTAITEAKSDAMLAAKQLNADANYQDALHKIEKFGAINNINVALGNMMQNVIQNVVAGVNAEATRRGAEQQKQQEMLDQTKDLFANAQQLMQSVIDLMQAVIAAESQSMRDAIQA